MDVMTPNDDPPPGRKAVFSKLTPVLPDRALKAASQALMLDTEETNRG